MAASMITSPLVAPTSLPSLSRRGSNFAVVQSGGKKIKVDKPLGTYVDRVQTSDPPRECMLCSGDDR
jgi:hypothetical protein